MTSAALPWTRDEMLADLYRRQAEQDRRAANRKRTGLVTDVEPSRGPRCVRVNLGADPVSGDVFKSPWLPVQEIAAGGLKSSFLPTVGEQVDVVSETGDLADAYVSLSLPTTTNPRPHDKPGEGMLKAGERTSYLIKDGRQVIRAPRVDINPVS